jgi:DNA primase
MAGLCSDDLKRRIQDSNNIVEVIQAAVGKLTRAGRNLKCCCPFHNEKTPSFNVNAEGQYFKCFGCGKGGDVFTFVMLQERVEFPEAMQILADRAGIRMEANPVAAEQYKKETDWKSYLYKLNDAAARFYREQLFADAGKTAREYIKKRGLSEEMCEQFRIGYAPAGGSPLLGRLSAQNAPKKAIIAAGLATQRDDGLIRDFFYDRLMFPIADIQGRIIAFGGRILGDGEPKYLNTRETPLFSKTKTVYALNFAKEQIVSTRQATIVEGYTDVMMCHQFGITNVVACLGTAITADHIRQLRRVADSLLLMTDSDDAGAKASERSLSVIFQEEMPARVTRLPGADKDPCDFLLANGREPFDAALKESIDLFDYKFEMVRKKHDLLSPMGVKNAAEDLMGLISLIPDPILKNRYRYEVLRRLNIDERDLRYEARPAAAAENSSGDDSAGGMGMVPPPENEQAKLERELLNFLFHEPAWMEAAVGQLDLATLTGQPESILGKCILAAMADGALPPDPDTLATGAAGSVVARELLRRIPNSLPSEKGSAKETERRANSGPENSGEKLLESARSLCIALAEGMPHGVKLEASVRLQMVIRPIRKAALYRRHEEANRQLAHARLNGDTAGVSKAGQLVVQLRKAIAELKSQSSNGL